jgi:hypothetical protein
MVFKLDMMADVEGVGSHRTAVPITLHARNNILGGRLPENEEVSGRLNRVCPAVAVDEKSLTGTVTVVFA